MLSMNSGTGRYRLLLQAHVVALQYLFDAYPDACAALLLSPPLQCHATLSLFPSSALLKEAVQHHDQYPLLTHHKGKWNCVAVLGTLTAALMGNYFQTTYIPPPVVSVGGPGGTTKAGSDWWAVLTVSTGMYSEELLIQKSAKTKGEALKRACLEALRENFPRQHAEVIRVHPDVDLSHDTLAKSSKYRSLPRDKRVEHIQSLFAMVCAFAEEDLGWFQPRIRFRNASMELGFPQWVAELEATVEEDQERRIVAVSRPHPHSRTARRMLIWSVAEQYFPKELGYYRALKRGDGVHPLGEDADRGSGTASSGAGRRFQYYKPHTGIAFVEQLFELMAPSHTSLLPFSWTLKGVAVGRRRSRSAYQARRNGQSEGKEKEVVEEEETFFSLSDMIEDGDPSYWGDGETPERLLEPLCIQYEASVLGNHGDLLIADYRGKRLFSTASHAPRTSLQKGGGGGGYSTLGTDDDPEDVTEERRQESPVEVLLTALKMASHHLCQSESETMWTEFETHEPPAMPTTRDLCLYLFYALWGNRSYAPTVLPTVSSASSTTPSSTATGGATAGRMDVPIFSTETPSAMEWSGVEREKGNEKEGGEVVIAPAACVSSVSDSHAPQPVVDVHAMKVGDQWVATLTLPLLGSLPVARAYGSTKKKSVKDALTLATRLCFPQILHYWMRNTPSASELAKEILTEPITSALPEAIKRDIRRQLQQEKKKVTHPFPLLLKYLRDEFKGARQLRVDRSRATGNEWQCRLYVQQRKLKVEKGLSQLVGYGAASQPEKALYTAACMALENLYDVKYTETIGK